MFPPEDNEGNVEYKRHLCSSEILCGDDNFSIRFHQLVTQLQYRVNEGNGIAVYYLGVNDDGSKYNLSSEERTKSLDVLKQMVLFLNYKISNCFFNDDYIKVIIQNKLITANYPEKRILLLGDTESGKTTFLAYLVKNKLDTPFCKARLYILNHKHEIETGKTSSFNYQHVIHNKVKYVFIDTPGDPSFTKNSKTRNKIILSFNYDLILFMNKGNNSWNKYSFYIYIASYLKIPWIDVDLFNPKSDINLINPLPKRSMLEYFSWRIIDKPKLFSELVTNFYSIQSFPHHDMGWIISGFLEGGNLKLDQDLFWYEQDKVSVKLNSIYVDNQPIESINGPSTVTLTLKKLDQITNKPRKGFLSNINYNPVEMIKLGWIYFNEIDIIEEKDIIIYLKNQIICLKKINKNYKLISPSFSYNLLNKFFIYEKDNRFGFGKVFTAS